jgi:uroporphyrin-III C-methyltransferase / precorrin-2 dehydrogenase / sirohydrochlorin ferrochelatase
VAAPELAGIPLTHRGVASGFLVTAGHAGETLERTLDAVAPNSVTVVIMMGVAARAQIAARLEARGWSAATPAAILCGAATPDVWTWTGTLAEMALAAPPADEPGVLVLGDVIDVLNRSAEASTSDGAERARRRRECRERGEVWL